MTKQALDISQCPLSGQEIPFHIYFAKSSYNELLNFIKSVFRIYRDVFHPLHINVVSYIIWCFQC